MLIMKTGKRQKKTDELELPNQNAGRKEKLELIGNIGSRHQQTSRDERRNNERVPKTTEEASRNENLLQKSHRKHQHLGCPPCNLLETIVEMNKRTHTNEPEEGNVDDDMLLHPRDDIDML